MPAWASVLIALVSGFGSGAVAAVLTTRNDRRDRFRHRLIEAADDFASAASEALTRTRDAIRDVRDFRDAEQMKAATDSAWAQRDAALHRSARVDLLFGPGQDASRCASDVVLQLASVVSSLMPPSPNTSAADRAHMEAVNALRGFNLAAADAIEKAAPPVMSPVDRERHGLTKRRRGSWRR